METKAPIVKLKAEKVGDFKFTPERSGKPHTSDFEAVVNVKVGESEMEINVHQGREYHSSVGTYGTPTYIDSFTEYFPALGYRNNEVDKLKNVGVEIDFSEVFTHFEEAMKEVKLAAKEWELQVEINRLEQRKTDWENSWIHKFDSVIKADKNKKIKAAKYTITPCDKDNYVNSGGYLFITLEYNGYKGIISKEDGRFVFNHAYTKMENDERLFSETARKKAKNEGTIFLKFIEGVDEGIAIKKSRKERAQTEAEKRAVYAAHLKEVSGYEIEVKAETRYHSDYRGRRQWNDTYIEYTYYAKLKNRLVSVSFFERENVKLYSVAGLRNLKSFEFKSILDILNLAEKE